MVGVTTLQAAGPSANRVDVVFVGDGYTASELGKYAAHVDVLRRDLYDPSRASANRPLDGYGSYFNVHRVDVVSPESGIDNRGVTPPVCRNTALDVCASGSAMFVDVPKALCAAHAAPDVDFIVFVANAATYSVALYYTPEMVGVTGDHHSAGEAMLHEFGHTFGGLTDEYEIEGPCYSGPEPSHPNATIYAAAELIARRTKWYRWLDLDAVHTFEGGYYARCGAYRPTRSSKMREFGRPFGEVNGEQIIFNLYCLHYAHPQRRRVLVRPIDAATPPSPAPLPADTVFSVTPIRPVGRSLQIRWSIDGVDIPGADRATFTAPTACLSAGLHRVAVFVTDNTPQVRDEDLRRTWMSERREWWIEAFADCNGNGRPDDQDIATGASLDANGNGVPDECEPASDCNLNGRSDLCDLALGLAEDCDANGEPDECDIGTGALPDDNANGRADACEPDCNANGRPDGLDIAGGTSADWNGDGIPDECGTDCNGNGAWDWHDISAGTSADCNRNGVPDECETAGGASPDCNGTGVPDECDLDPSDPDGNGLVSRDTNRNGTPDECEPDCNRNGVPDEVDVNPADPDGDGVVSPDCNYNRNPDECEADSDQDGIIDACDNCPQAANADQADADADGAGDACDLCPNTTPGVSVAADGCFGPDSDGDMDVDLSDYFEFQTCFNGPNRLPGLQCRNAPDFDHDGDVDLADFSEFQACFNGPNRPPACPWQ